MKRGLLDGSDLCEGRLRFGSVEARLRWFGHLHSGYIGQKMLRIELPGRR